MKKSLAIVAIALGVFFGWKTVQPKPIRYVEAPTRQGEVCIDKNGVKGCWVPLVPSR